MSEPTDPDDPMAITTRAFTLLRRIGEGKTLKPDQVHELLELLKTMLGSNVTTILDSFRAEMNSKLAAIDSFRAEMNSKLAAIDSSRAEMNSKINSIRWLIGIVGGAMTILFAAITVFVAILALGG